MRSPTKSLQSKSISDQEGFVLVLALMIMTLLALIGISATSSSILELQISGADRTHAETFYQADGGTQLAVRLIEESLGATDGFSQLKAIGAKEVLEDPTNPNDTVLIENKKLWNNETKEIPSDTTRDAAFFPSGFNPTTAGTSQRTNITVAGVTTLSEGEGLQMVSGYEGKGKGTAGGGGKIVYTILSQHIGKQESETVVQVEWRHVIGLELEGRY